MHKNYPAKRAKRAEEKNVKANLYSAREFFHLNRTTSENVRLSQGCISLERRPAITVLSLSLPPYFCSNYIYHSNYIVIELTTMQMLTQWITMGMSKLSVIFTSSIHYPSLVRKNIIKKHRQKEMTAPTMRSFAYSNRRIFFFFFRMKNKNRKKRTYSKPAFRATEYWIWGEGNRWIHDINIVYHIEIWLIYS